MGKNLLKKNSRRRATIDGRVEITFQYVISHHLQLAPLVRRVDDARQVTLWLHLEVGVNGIGRGRVGRRREGGGQLVEEDNHNGR